MCSSMFNSDLILLQIFTYEVNSCIKYISNCSKTYIWTWIHATHFADWKKKACYLNEISSNKNTLCWIHYALKGWNILRIYIQKYTYLRHIFFPNLTNDSNLHLTKIFQNISKKDIFQMLYLGCMLNFLNCNFWANLKWTKRISVFEI